MSYGLTMKPTVTFHNNCEKASKTATEGHCSWVVEQQLSAALLDWSPAMGFVRLQTGYTHFLPEISIKGKNMFRELYNEPCQSRLAFKTINKKQQQKKKKQKKYGRKT